MKQTFESWLQEHFIELRETHGVPITKDNCEDLFDSYLENMDGDDYLKLGDLYGQSQYIEGKDEILNKF